MIVDLHFLRPFWLFSLLPLGMLGFGLLKQKSSMDAWRHVCDAHLLPHLLQIQGKSKRVWPLLILMSSGLCMIIALAGPTWLRIEVPTYQHIRPRMLVLDMSDTMLEHDLAPDRLTRAKFKIRDMLQHRDAGQFGLMVYTSEPFVVSPLTDDGQTIEVLLSSLTPTIMPVGGNQLEHALKEAKTLITETGSQSGELLVFTAQIPSNPAVNAAQTLANSGFHVSVMPMLDDKTALPLFAPLAKAGRGEVIPFTSNNADIERWLKTTHTKSTYQTNDLNDIPLWRDEGRWFIIAALLLLLPGFWRGWLQRITT
ncbi:MAG: VWA domain-containing protein [Legionellaceae bacterium]|nr:VWA domain-containing protein [Legionellaceae bacterium]